MAQQSSAKAAQDAVDQFTMKVKAATESMKGLSAAASASGMKSANSGFELMGATLGSVLQPAFVLLSAGVMTLADAFWNDLKPNLASTVDGFVKFGETIVSATKAVYDFMNSFGKGGKYDLNIAGALGEKHAADLKGKGLDDIIAQGNRARDAGKPNRPLTIEEMQAGWAAQGGGGAAAGGGAPAADGGGKGFNFGKAFAENLKGIIADQKMAMGGGASFGGIADAWKKMQISTSQTNFQAKMMDRFEKTVQLLDRIALGMDRNRPAIGN